MRISLVNKTFFSRPRARPRLFSQDQGETFYFEIKTKSKTFCRSLELAAIGNITSTNAVISQIYTQSSVLIIFCPSTMNKHSNHHHHVTGIIMSPLYAVICRLPISSLSSLSLQTAVSSVAFCQHHVTQQQVIHPGSVRPDEQNSVAEYIIHFSSKSNKLSKFCHLISICLLAYTMLQV